MQADVAISGAGITGSALALALSRNGFSVLLFDAAPSSVRRSPGFDCRAYALSVSSCRLLQALGLADRLADRSQPIRSVVITDGRAGEGAGPVVLTFDAREIRLPSLGCMIEDKDLRPGLLDLVAEEPLIKHVSPAAVEDCEIGSAAALLKLADGGEHSAGLVVGCDGRNGRVARSVGTSRLEKDYGQSAVVCTIQHQTPHDGVARQFFMPTGPLAILPLPGNRSSIVWTETAADASRLVGLPEDAFMCDLRQRFGDFLGRLELASRRIAWPLSMSIAETLAEPRMVLAGESAHGLHPLAGQGLNVGLRDVAALTDVLSEARGRGEDFGSLAVLRRYQQWRRIDGTSLAMATTLFNSVFSNDSELMRAMRGAGMQILNIAPGMRRALIKEAAGLTGDLPKLMSGSAA